MVARRDLLLGMGAAAVAGLSTDLGLGGAAQAATGWGRGRHSGMPFWLGAHGQIAELERIQGYLIEASEDTVDSVLMLRDEFLNNIGVTDRHMYRAVRQAPQGPYQRKSGRSHLN